ncbi:MAG: glycoside hydrolase family 3 C-terminal domain-containing protein [Deltaproteobacteria bacterium]|nr:glycoside hydrolase family 3 C-terminal domain-containing protein [Deltaproteobacteria bacterium]
METRLRTALFPFLLTLAACGSLRRPVDGAAAPDTTPLPARPDAGAAVTPDAGAERAARLDADAASARDAGADRASDTGRDGGATRDAGIGPTPGLDGGALPGRSPSWADERVQALIAQMTLREKIAQLSHAAPAISRLGLARYNYWSEGLHGVLTDGATSFPQAIALASAWDPALLERVASAIGDEARGFGVRSGKGLTYWSPVINMLRDPRWGRFDESYTEDPYLMARLGVAFVRGLQGSHPKYLKAVATPKHYVANNSEFNRHTGSSEVDEQLLHEYYLPAFEATVVEAGAFSVMAAYNRVNGVPASANPLLLRDILRDAWGFQGYVVSDCGAVDDIVSNHHFTATAAEAAAQALLAGTDLNCGWTYLGELQNAVDQGLIVESDVDRALARVLRARFLLGEFDPADQVPYRAIGEDVIESPAHAALALEAARAAIVLLKNDGILPLDGAALRSIAVLGPHGDSVELGGYSGNPSRRVSALAALRARFPESSNVAIEFEPGGSIGGDKDQEAIDRAADLAGRSDVALVFVGTDSGVLREEMDRPDWNLPGAQGDLIQAVHAANPRTVVVLVTAGPVAVDWAQANVPAILTGFYDGQEQGTAIVDALFGDTNPGGKLTTTWYTGDATLPDMGDYDLRKGRTYLYYQGKPLYPFGHGLSYTTFSYSGLRVVPAAIGPEESVTVSVEVENTGSRAGDEVVQIYVHDPFASVPRPLRELRGFARVRLDPGQSETVSLSLPAKSLAFWDVAIHGWRVEAGVFDIAVGSSSTDIRAQASIIVR